MTERVRLVSHYGGLPEPWREQAMHLWGAYVPRLLDLEEWADEFEGTPNGPSLHLLALDGADRVIGHYAGIPIRVWDGERSLSIAKGEAYVVDSAHRKSVVDVDGRLRRVAVALTDVMYTTYRDYEFVGFVAQATPQAERRHIASGLHALPIYFQRFVLFADPVAALRRSGSKLGRGLFASVAGEVLHAVASIKRVAAPRSEELYVGEVQRFEHATDASFRGTVQPVRLRFDPSAEQLNWRFTGAGYSRLVVGEPAVAYVVTKGPDEGGRVRVVDWAIPANYDSVLRTVASALSQHLARSGGVALSWNIPVNSTEGRALASALHRTAFLRVPGTRLYNLLVHGDPRVLDATVWILTASLQERF